MSDALPNPAEVNCLFCGDNAAVKHPRPFILATAAPGAPVICADCAGVCREIELHHAIADRIEAHGCQCDSAAHLPWCPVALAAAIRGGFVDVNATAGDTRVA